MRSKKILNSRASFPLNRDKGKAMALTFDDGPHPKYTPLILDVLKKFEVKATFFLVGKRARQNPGLVKRISDEGHDMGNHTYSHPVSPVASPGRIEKEIKLTSKIIRKITGKNIRLFRPTWGKWDINSSKMTSAAKKTGCLSVRWTVSSRDWLGIRKIIEQSVLHNGMGSREIILFHDGTEKAPLKNRTTTADILPEFLNRYNDYRFLKLTDFFVI